MSQKSNQRIPKVKSKYHKKCAKVTQEKITERVVRSTEGEGALKGKHVERMMTSEGWKEILIPSKEPNYYSILLTENEFEKLRQRAVVLTKEEKLKLFQEEEERQLRLKEESTKRKSKLQAIDKAKAGDGSKLTTTQQEEKDKAHYLLERAWELLQENEDEVKVANSLILKTKCQAIRDAQIAERMLIKKAMEDEKRKEGKVMEEERLKRVTEEKRKEEVKIGKQKKYMQELSLQISTNEAKRLIEAERKMEESRLLEEEMKVLWKEEKEKQEMLKQEREALKVGLDIANQTIMQLQAKEKEELRIADLKVQEYMKMKAEREEKLDREKKEQAKKKELETARLRSLQKKAEELQSVLVEQAAIRRQEEYERVWRQKELEAVRKKKQTDEECKKERANQVNEMRKLQAQEIACEKRENERVLKVQLEALEREKRQEEIRKKKNTIYREKILEQINEKERKRTEQLQEKYAEGMALRAVNARRTNEINKALNKKIDSLKKNKIPEMYINEVKRQLCL